MAKKTVEEDVDPVFVDEEEAEVSFVNEEDVEEEEDPDKGLSDDEKKVSKKDLYAKVRDLESKATSDPTDKIVGAFQTAADRIQGPAPQAVQVQGETEAQFKERLKKDLFDEEKSEGVLNELIDRRLGPRLQQTLELGYKQAERIMELDPETGPSFRKYKSEINKYIATNFPATLQKDPRVLELAFKQVQVLHLDEIAQERANTILEKERKKEPSRREPIPLEGGGNERSSSPQGSRKIIVKITQEDRRKADELGVDASVIAEQRSRKRL